MESSPKQSMDAGHDATALAGSRAFKSGGRLSPRARLALAALLLLSLFGSGCATQRLGPLTPAELEKHIRSTGAVRTVVPYAIDQEMRLWLLSEVSKNGGDASRLGALAERLLAVDGLGIKYGRDVTGTAREVFDTRLANCLAFTNLFVGFARELDIEVEFLAVRDLDTYSREGDLVVHSDHVAVGFGPSHQMTIIDFATEPGLSYRRIRTLTDAEATGLYYSNRGTELLRDGEIDAALGWLTDAVRVAPSLSAAWVNLGVVQRRAGHSDLAEDSYRQALVINADEFSAYQNLATLLRMSSRDSEAADLLAVLGESGSRNPYAFLALGDLSRKNGRWQEAERFYRRALRVQSGDAEPLAALGSVALNAGSLKTASRWLRRAQKIDPEALRVRALAVELEQVRSEQEVPKRNSV